MKSNHSLIRILLFTLFVVLLLYCCSITCFAQNKHRIKRVRRFKESELYNDIIKAEDDEFVDDIPIDNDEFKDDDQDDVDYENCIEYQGGHQETYIPRREQQDTNRGDGTSSASFVAGPSATDRDGSDSQQRLSFNPYSYYKGLLNQDFNYVKYYGDKVNNKQAGAAATDPQYSQIAKKYANNLANHAKYLYKYRTFAPPTYRKYILQVYEYSKRVVEVAKVQNWNGYMYYLSITIEYYRKIDVLEQIGYGGTSVVHTTPVATYYGAAGTPTAYYSNGAPPPAAAGTVATAVATSRPSYYPTTGGYAAGYPANYYPANYGGAAYGGYAAGYPGGAVGGYPSYYPATNYNYGYPSSYYPAQYYQQRPAGAAVAATTAAVATTKADSPSQASTTQQATSNTSTTNATASSSASASSSSTANNASGTTTTTTAAQKKKINPMIEQLEKLNSQLSSHVGEFNDDASKPTTEPFTFEYLM